jgi:hypothetical protein
MRKAMKKFKPFMFKILTEKEARILWHILNCPMSGVDKFAWLTGEGEDTKGTSITNINDELWNRFNKKYPIKGYVG